MKSLFFEDLKTGMEFRTELSEPFTREMIESFAALTGDRAHPPTVQGNLVVACSGGLLFELGHFNETLYAQAAKDTVFKKPLLIGERIYVTEKVLEPLEDRPGKPFGRVLLKRLTFNDKNECILLTRQDYRILKRTT